MQYLSIVPRVGGMAYSPAVGYNHKSMVNVPNRKFVDPTLAIMGATIGATGLVGAGAFIASRYRISNPNQYLVRTGLGIPDISVTKKGIQWPFQSFKFVSMEPYNYAFDLHCMSIEKLEFSLPGVFTIGPRDDKEAIKKYVKLLEGMSSTDVSLDKIIKGILEGETRILAAQMTLEEIFNNRKSFKDKIIKNVQDELDQFGLIIYNSNIKELQDTEGSEYFKYIRQDKTTSAQNDALIKVAENKKRGDIGQKEREATRRQEVIRLECETIMQENIKKQEMARSMADLAIVDSQVLQKTKIAEIEAINNAKMIELDMQKEVEQKRISMTTEQMRANEMSKAQVLAETTMKDSEGKANAMRIEADATLYMKRKEADGLLALYDAQSQGIEKLVQSFGGDQDMMIKYMMINGGLYEKLAKSNAEAIRGLEPKITVWNTGSGGDNDYSKPISDVMKMLPPLLTTIESQTGNKLSDLIMPSKTQN